MWQSDVVTFLCDAKRSGWEFQAAWDEALDLYPPRGTGFGNGRRQQTLFGEEDGEPSLVEFLEAACRDAWFGRHPELRSLSPELMEGLADGTRAARRTAEHVLL